MSLGRGSARLLSDRSYLRIGIAGLLFASVAAVSSEASAKAYEVKMLTSGSGGTMVFEPALIRVSPGDTVTFQPADPGHNAESIPSMLPAGATPFKGEIGKPVTVRFAKPGLYGYKCLPHYTLGMVGLVQVGSGVNKSQAASAASQLPGLARTRMAALVTQAR